MANRDGLIEVTLADDGVVSPCVITPSTYGGVHEGGRWLAFPLPAIPRGAVDSETVVAGWFAKNAWRCGAGEDPNAALADLVRQMEDAERLGRARIIRS
jgi:hypothetical protein